ncbi:MAG: hypothetical protein M0023_08335 [Desulfobacteraceae bacterium]|nr:hypothetical protein [Desulfobacteraceae bacterium]
MSRENDYSFVITHLIEHPITQYLQAGPNNLEAQVYNRRVVAISSLLGIISTEFEQQ